jgi:hypothetical protein
MTDIVLRTAVQTKNIAFLCHKDDTKRKEEVIKHLTMVRRKGLISIIESSNTMPYLDIIIIIVSPSLMGDDKCINAIDYALAHQKGDQRIVPILVQKTNFGDHRLQKMQGLPRNGKPIEEWRFQSQALAEIAQEIEEIVMDQG